MNTKELIKIYRELINLLELNEENPFKIRAYEKSLDILKSTEMNLSELLTSANQGNNIGLGPQTIKDIKEVSETHKLQLHQDLLKQFPREQLELLNIRGLGPKKVLKLASELNIKSVAEFKLALAENKVSKIKGFGSKVVASLEESLDFYLESKEYFRLDTHEHILFEALKSLKGLCLPYGESLAKGETFKEVLLAYKLKQKEELEKLLKQANIDFSPDPKDKDTFRLIIDSYPLKLTSVSEENFLAINSDYSKENGILPHSLKGIIHVHSTYSDGLHSIRDLATEAMNLGYKYLAISDHSQTASYAGGLKPNDIKAQHKEIDKLNLELAPFRIFKGIESDILTDGSLDYSDDILKSFDFVIASVHSGFNISSKEMTDRIIKAIRNPYTTILGHPTGRLLLYRKGYELDLQEVLRIAQAEGVVVEINSNPKRLDVPWQEIVKLNSSDAMWAITPDAHSKEQLSLVKYGIMMANRAELKEANILNCMDTSQCSQYFKRRRNR